MIAEPPLDGGQVGDLPGTCSPRDKKQAGIPEASARGRRRAPPKERRVIAITDDVWYLDY